MELLRKRQSDKLTLANKVPTFSLFLSMRAVFFLSSYPLLSTTICNCHVLSLIADHEY